MKASKIYNQKGNDGEWLDIESWRQNDQGGVRKRKQTDPTNYYNDEGTQNFLEKRKQTGKDTYLFNISEDNQLFEYASYNTLFTLSALNQAELESPKTILNSKLHDIIVRSGGIGPGDTTWKGKLDPMGSGMGGGEWGGKGGEGAGLSKENQEIIAKHERMRKTHEKSQQEFRKNNDMYFRNVEMNSVPGYNEERRLTTVAKIQM